MKDEPEVFDLAPPIPTPEIWTVRDFFGDVVGTAPTLEAARAVAIEDDGRGRSWADLDACGLYTIEQTREVLRG